MSIESAPKPIPPEEPQSPKPQNKTDWSFVDKARQDAASSPEQSAQQELEAAAVQRNLVDDGDLLSQEITRKEYKKTKEAMERYRQEHKITKTPEELAEEDLKLKKRFGLE